MRDLFYGQAKINDTIQKKLTRNDKSLESIQAKLDGFFIAIKNQLSFNKTSKLARANATGKKNKHI